MTVDFDALSPTTRYVIERAAHLLVAQVRADVERAAESSTRRTVETAAKRAA